MLKKVIFLKKTCFSLLDSGVSTSLYVCGKILWLSFFSTPPRFVYFIISVFNTILMFHPLIHLCLIVDIFCLLCLFFHFPSYTLHVLGMPRVSSLTILWL